MLIGSQNNNQKDKIDFILDYAQISFETSTVIFSKDEVTTKMATFWATFY
jgi:hypothetical protein